uniref:Na_H_Exchanger domain-containing protein n=1 Tax=Panagrellus redivivus TaxID=6233 RepID=A0A7E4VM45_PANRE
MVAVQLKRVFDLLLQFLSGKQINLILTCALALLSVYITFVSVFHRQVFHPLAVWKEDSVSSNVTSTTLEKSDYASSAISIVILWISALIFGKLAGLVRLPPLLGMLIVGIIFGNVGYLHDSLVINKRWEETLRQLAFIVIMIRSGLSLDPEALKNSLYFCGLLGSITTTVEVISIALASYFLFGLPLSIAIGFGYVLAASSPAVTVPTMIQLQNEERGTDKGIPTIVLASATIDNLYSITAFYIVIATSLNATGPLSHVIPSILGEIIVALILGLLTGFILRILPRKESSMVHFSRATLLLCLALGYYYGSRALNYVIAGPVIVFLMCIVAALKWKHDNVKRSKPEERGFKIMWVLFFQPMLFALIGLFFDFSVITWKLFGDAVVVIVIGLIFRVIIAFIVSFSVSRVLKLKEHLFMSVVFCPKATVQAALAPALAAYCVGDYADHAKFVLQACVLSILITAPIGQVVILTLGRLFLTKRNIIGDSSGTPKLTSSIDKDFDQLNAHNIEINPYEQTKHQNDVQNMDLESLSNKSQ